MCDRGDHLARQGQGPVLMEGQVLMEVHHRALPEEAPPPLNIQPQHQACAVQAHGGQGSPDHGASGV